MSVNIDIISADISIFDDLTIFVMSFKKKKEYQKIFWTQNDVFVTSFLMLWRRWQHFGNAVNIKVGILNIM